MDLVIAKKGVRWSGSSQTALEAKCPRTSLGGASICRRDARHSAGLDTHVHAGVATVGFRIELGASSKGCVV